MDLHALLAWAWIYTLGGVMLLRHIPIGSGRTVVGVTDDMMATCTDLVVSFAGGMSVSFLFAYIFMRGFNAYFTKKLAQPLLVDNLIDIIALAEMVSPPRIKPDVTEELVLTLERAASRLERDLPAQLRARDAGTDAWLRGVNSIGRFSVFLSGRAARIGLSGQG